MTLHTFDIGARPQLALDHDLWEFMGEAQERLHAVSKRPTPVLAPETPWEGPGLGAVWGPLHVERDATTGRVKLWCQSFDLFPGRGPDMSTYCQSIAESDDGIHFTRPTLGLTEWPGAAGTNAYAIGRGRYTPPIAGHGTIDLINAAEAPEYPYKSITWMGRDPQRYGRHGVAFSPDGLRWTPDAGNRVSRFKNAGDVASSASLRDWFDAHAAGATTVLPSKYAIFPKMQVRRGRWSRRSFCVMFSEDSAPIRSPSLTTAS